MNHELHRGRGWARVGFWTGVCASVAANVAHAFIGGTPPLLMLMFAVLPPFALLVGIEVIAQVQWRRVWYQYVIRWGAVGSVAAIGGVVSYDHMRVALLANGEAGPGSVLLPLLIDGLMTVCSAALLTIGDNVRRAEREAADGVGSTDRIPHARAESRGGVTDFAGQPRSDVKADVSASPATTRVATPRPLPPAAVKVAKVRQANPDMPQESVARRTGLALRTVQRHWNAATPVATPVVHANGTQVPNLVPAN